jgi:O-antigen/teichoic acid export membrane protein
MSGNYLSIKRAASNSLLLYVRMAFVMLLNLFTVRIVLNALGSIDYGINDVVAGVVTMLISINGVLATSTQRYYSFSIVGNNIERLQSVFSTSINIYVILSLIIIFLGETIGLWFINNYLIIPANRVTAANWIYQFSLFSFIFTLMQVPYSAAIMAHEDMAIFSIISIAECILKFLAALTMFLIPIDTLIVYGSSLFCISVIVFISYVATSRFKYLECRYKKQKDGGGVFKELVSFSGWSLFGSLASVGMSQIITILVNIFFGPLYNASRAISFQFNNALSSLTASFLMALRPQMIMAYAEHSYTYLNKLFSLSNKFIYYGLLVVVLPLFFEMKSILYFWLNTTDAETILFSRLILVYTLLMSLNNPISIIIQAIGRVKEYHIPVEAFTLSCVPITYFLYRHGFPAYSTYFVMIIVTVASHIIRLVCLKKYYKPYSHSEYLKSFILPAVVITILSSLILYIFSMVNMIDWIRIPFYFIITGLVIFSMVFIFGLSNEEKKDVRNLILILKSKYNGL